MDVLLAGGGAERAARDLTVAAVLGGSAATVRAAEAAAALPGSIAVVLTEGVNEGARHAEDGALIADRAPDATLVVAGRPSAARCDALLEATRFPRGRVVGSAPAAVAALLRAHLARELGLEPADLPAAGLEAFAGEEAFARAAAAAREGEPGEEAEAAAAAAVAGAVALDSRRLLACTLRCGGEHGIDGRTAGVPVVLGAAGVERVPETGIGATEFAALQL